MSEKKKTKSIMGRPSLYKPEYCEKLIKHMRKGLSFESFAGVVDVNIDTLYEWEKVHANFSEAKKIAFAKCRLFWEKKGHQGLYPKMIPGEKGVTLLPMNSSVWIFNMKNRFGWKDRPEEKQVTVKGFKFVEEDDDDEDE